MVLTCHTTTPISPQMIIIKTTTAPPIKYKLYDFSPSELDVVVEVVEVVDSVQTAFVVVLLVLSVSAESDVFT